MSADLHDGFGRARWLLGLFLIGLLSGFLTCCTAPLYTAPPYTADSGGISTFGLTGSPLAGPLFGLAISLSFWLHKSLNSIWRLLGIMVASALADFTAGLVGYYVFLSPVYPAHLSLGFDRFGAIGDYAGSLIAGGFVGGAILFLALWFLLAVPQNWPRFFLGFLIYSLAGSSLAVLGWALAPSLGAILWHILNFFHLDKSTAETAQGSSYAAFYSLYVVWQSGMAILLGVLLPQRPEEFGSPERDTAMNVLRLSP